MTKTAQAPSSHLHHARSIIFVSMFITGSSAVMAQAIGGGVQNARGGAGNFFGAGGIGTNAPDAAKGGGGGGSGITGGAGGTGSGGAAGGAGGAAAGGAGQEGAAATGSNQSGGGGGGGAAGLVVTTDYTNGSSVTGGAGGAGGAGNGVGAQGSGGGGGTGVIVNGAVLFTNTGAINGGAGGSGSGNGFGGAGVGLLNSGSVVNSGTISSGGSDQSAVRLTNSSTSSSITNLNGGTISGGGNVIDNEASNTTITNHGTIQGGAWNSISNGSVSNTTITNNGTINGSGTNIIEDDGSSHTRITNNGTIGLITAVDNDNGAINFYYSTNATVINNGTISSNLDAIISYGDVGNTSIDLLTNAGSIVAGRYGIRNLSVIIQTITNTGTITGSGGYGIWNDGGTIVNLNNLQGVGNAAGALTYSGVLPTHYNIIINSTTSFGQLTVTSGTGSTLFGIYAGSSLRGGYTYSAVLRGIGRSNLTNLSLTGTYGSYSWTLNPQATCTTNCIFDLTISGSSGPPTDDTQKSLVATSASLLNSFVLQHAVLTHGFAHDCTQFGTNGVCISAGGRNTAVSAANGLNNTSALLIAAYRPHPNYRIGAYADQNLSVSHASTAVSLGNSNPLMGVFGVWNERSDGTGAEVKFSAAYGRKDTTVSRQVVGGSESGAGSSQLISQGAQIIAKYGFAVTEKAMVSPYFGMRYTQNNMASYTEDASATVTAPLTYAALKTHATTAMAGLGVSYKVIPELSTFASAGLESDASKAHGSFTGTSASIAGLTPVSFQPNPVKSRRSVTLGAYYDVAKNKRLRVAGVYRQEPFQSGSSTTVWATYTVGL